MNERKRLAVKRRVATVYGTLARTGRRRVIISYHAVGSGPWSTTESTFREQMVWLASHTAVRPLADLLAGPVSAQAIEVAVTFDDGYESVLTTAAPVLVAQGILPTVFLSTSRIVEEHRLTSDDRAGYYPGERFLIWDEVGQLRATGWGIGSHTVEHLDLTVQSLAVVREQLTQSKHVIESRLGVGCSLLAYPFGRHNRGVRAVARASGYEWALASTHGALGSVMDPHAVPRIDIRRNYTLQDFIGIVRGDWDYLRWGQTVRHTWRFPF